jgi:hypothetical protein
MRTDLLVHFFRPTIFIKEKIQDFFRIIQLTPNLGKRNNSNVQIQS